MQWEIQHLQSYTCSRPMEMWCVNTSVFAILPFGPHYSLKGQRMSWGDHLLNCGCKGAAVLLLLWAEYKWQLAPQFTPRAHWHSLRVFRNRLSTKSYSSRALTQLAISYLKPVTESDSLLLFFISLYLCSFWFYTVFLFWYSALLLYLHLL